MATIFFTSTAATGDGTLRAAIQTAQTGDVVKPDPDVFPPGQTIDITLGGSLAPTASITLDASGRNLIIRQTIPLNVKASDGCDSIVVSNVTFAGRVIVTGAAASPVTATFNRCTFGSGAAEAALYQSGSGYSTSTFNDCLFTGSLTYAVYLSGSSVAATFNRCTIAGNVGVGLYGNAASGAIANDSIVDPNLSTAGFINAPTDVSGYSTSNLPPWETWDFRLLTSSSYASGATTGEGKYDRDGVLRGQSGGAYALGCYEANGAAFWIGKDSEGSAVSSVLWNSADGWASSPTATASDLATAPAVVCIVNQSLEFTDAPSLSRLIVANASVTLADAGGGAITTVNLDRDGVLTETADTIGALTIAPGARFSGNWSDVTATTIRAGATVEIDDAQLGTLVLDAGATLRIADGKLVGVATATIGAAAITATTRAYFGVSPATDASAATFSNVVRTPRGAGVTAFKARAADGVATFEIDQTTANVPVLLEVLDGGAWTTVSTEATEATTAPIGPGVTTFRVCDGVAFMTDAVAQRAKIWSVEAWGVNAGGGADAKAWAVHCWGISPQNDHK
ncbi:MAG: hypothetical protein IJL92_08775 [Thermoguttaceae bacterium]|nr:hypothetical protein [Thermoguttaceae bacterium]